MSMKRQATPRIATDWQTLPLPDDTGLSSAMQLRVQTVPPRHYFPAHTHPWNQLVYASSGVLTVTAAGHCFVIAPRQAVWVPTGVPHQVGSLYGAEYRSLYGADDPPPQVADSCTVFVVTAFLRALILEASRLGDKDKAGNYGNHIDALILEQLRRLRALPASLPWPRHASLQGLCETLYGDPADPRSLDDWATALNISGRTLSRRFERETGLTLRVWRQRLRLFKAIELLGSGMAVTRAALELGYATPSAFIHMFRSETGMSPLAYRQAVLAEG